MERRSTGLTDSTRSCAWTGDWTADGARFAASSLERGLAGAAELATLDTSLRSGNGLPHAGGDTTAFIYAQATTFIHAYATALTYAHAATLKCATLADARRSSTFHVFTERAVFAEPALLAVHAAKPFFTASGARDRAATHRLLGDARVRSPIAGPVSSAVKKRPAGVIVGPVGAQDERHDRDIDHVDIIRQINVAASIEILEILGRNPAAVAGPAYIAPGIASEAPVNVDVGAAGDSVDHWKSVTRAGSEAHRVCDNSPRRHRSGGHC
jgi:hypothetical protein